MTKFVGDGARRCPTCSRMCPTKKERGKLYLMRHPFGARNCPGSGQKVSNW